MGPGPFAMEADNPKVAEEDMVGKVDIPPMVVDAVGTKEVASDLAEREVAP